ncbi:hypothetical protein HYC85_015687 [Camellia sinensis]|uniref:Cyclin N-terminal domain-containing protein n=1 Tax=Camellia sinensis TaxID=4442 RepID=A0A7J7GXK6_CAMSI|nr:hypothetical protein HYC85_015687 [Camellia sinensis]
MSSELCSGVRLRLLEFLIHSAHELQVRPIVKYSAFSLFADRFCHSLSKHSNDMENWLLHPMRESNLQLFALVSIWISSKMHDSHPLSVKCLKSLGDKMIKEQHFTTRDFLEAVLDFEIGTSNIAFIFLEELFIQFKGIATVGKLVASYVITVPKQRWEFPVLPWVKFVTSCKEEDIIEIVRDILQHVFQPSSVV